MSKQRSLFGLLFTITALDNVISALTVLVIMQLISVCHGESSCSNAGIPDNIVFLTSYIILLSPTYLFSTPIIGYIADKYGRKFSLQICLLLSLIGYLLLLLASIQQNVLLALLAALLLNAGASSMTPVQAVIADISNGIQKSYRFGLLVFITLPLYLLFAEVSRLYLQYFHSTINARNGLIIVALIVTCFNLLLLNFGIVVKRKSFQFNQKPSLLSLTEVAPIFTQSIILLLIIFAFFEFASSWHFEHISDFHTETIYFLKIASSSILLYKITCMMFGLFVLYPFLLKKFTSHQILFLSLALGSLGSLGYSLTANHFVHWIFIALFALAEVILIPTIWRLLSDYTSPYHQGLIMGIKASVWSLMWSLGVIADSKVDPFVSPYFCVVAINILTITSLLLGKYYLQKSTSGHR